MRKMWEKRRKMERAMKRTMKKMTLMGHQGREQLRRMMKRMKLKPRNRRQISSSVWRTTPSRASFPANLQHLSPPFLRTVLNREFVCIFIYILYFCKYCKEVVHFVRVIFLGIKWCIEDFENQTHLQLFPFCVN